MIIVDLKDLEDQARAAAESAGVAALAPEALLLLISEVRRMKLQLEKQYDSLSGMRDELLQLRTELVALPGRGPASQSPAPPKTQGKMLKMKVLAKDGNAAS